VGARVRRAGELEPELLDAGFNAIFVVEPLCDCGMG
jgi:hypothetical protein